MKLTNEQKSILDEVKKGTKVIKINAFAGTGKTTTLVEIAKANRDKKILYLAFNKAIQQEGLKKFPKNVDVKTTHSLAYRYIIAKSKVKTELKANYRVYEISDMLNIPYQDALTVSNYFEFYLNSAIFSIKDLKLSNDIIKNIITLWDLMEKREIPVTHSFYLKMFEKMLLRENIKINYDIVLLDEAQDTNDVTLSIFRNIKAKQKVLVGDRHQQIYSFRGSINAMNKIEGKDLYLTNSFRFNQNIADKANKILNLFKGETHTLKGLGESKSENTKAIITRTNSKLIKIIDDLLSQNINFKTIRDPYEIFGLSLNILNLLKNNEIDNRFAFLKSLAKGLNSILPGLEKIAIEADDMELYGAVKNVEFYEDKLYDLYRIAKKNFKIDKDEIDIYLIYLTTAHTSKGLEFDIIKIEDDFNLTDIFAKWYMKTFEFDEKNKKNDYISQFLEMQKKQSISTHFQKIIDEFNLYYVALTRARTKVKDTTELSDKLDNKELINEMIYKKLLFKIKKEKS